MDWLQLLAAALDDEAVLIVLRRDLRQALIDDVDIDPRDGYMLVPVDEEFEVQRAGDECRVDALLVGPDGHGEDVSLAWNRQRAWWTALPPPEDAELTVDGLPFPVRVSAHAWPDVWVEIFTERAPVSGDDARLVRCLADWRNARNSAGPGVVHDISEPRVSPGRIEIHVDFGSAGPETLHQLLGALADAPLVAGIAAVEVQGFSQASREPEP